MVFIAFRTDLCEGCTLINSNDISVMNISYVVDRGLLDVMTVALGIVYSHRQ